LTDTDENFLKRQIHIGVGSDLQKSYTMIWKDKEVLHLVLMKDPFVRIANGIKLIEYRDKTDYWNQRLFGKDIHYIFFQYAYHKNPTHMVVQCTKVELTDRWELHLGEIIHLQNNHLIKDIKI